ncbi:MAG TPA: Hpt domain-containing protein [Verrucomicrobiae bacterium]|jgi:HPt (histidine-containing phosphotransfer) domain-containing protein|nr:Hpt domain-containing protein [Verrucomicrobiae bacterium]
MTDSLPSDGPPLIDFDQLHAATDGDAEVMRELVALYFQQADEIMAGLRAAVQKRDVAEVNHLAHKLAGSSLACGMSAAAPPLRVLEHNAREGRVDGAEEPLALAARQIELMRAQIETVLVNYKK